MTEEKKDISFLLRKQHELEDSTDDLKKKLVKLNEVIEDNQQARIRQSKKNIEEENELINSRYFLEISNINMEMMTNYNQISMRLASCKDEIQKKIDKNRKKLTGLSQQIIKQKKEEDKDGKDVSK